MSQPAAPSALRRMACWAVHLYTASGVVMAFAALSAIIHGNPRAAFLWLFVAVAIDATDGAFARMARVKEVLPEFDGAKLDDIVDYLTFVLVPVVAMGELGLLVGWTGAVAASAALLASAYRFCHAAAKTQDHFFTGFPSYWNVILLYFYVFDLAPAICAALVLILAALVLAPLKFIYPSRLLWMREWTVGLGIVWGVLVFAVVVSLPDRSRDLAAASLVYPLYYTLLSFYLQWRGTTPVKQSATR